MRVHEDASQGLYMSKIEIFGKRENWQFVDLSRLQFTSEESEFIPDYI
jgi:mannose/fructose-specific phosphotransferase system component IIA